jgi:protein MAK11
MWNLVKGRCTYTTQINGASEAEGVAFAPSGDSYALLCGNVVSLHGVGEAGSVLGTLQHPRRVMCMAYAGSDALLLTGSEDGALRLWDTQHGKEVLCISRAHGSRVRSLVLPHSSSSSREGGGSAVASEHAVPALVATASSDGTIKLWDLVAAVEAARAGGEGGASSVAASTACIAQAETRARLTTLCAVDPQPVMVARLKEQAAKRKLAAAAGAQGAGTSGGDEGGKAAAAAAGGQKKRKQCEEGEGVSWGDRGPGGRPKAQGKEQRQEGQRPSPVAAGRPAAGGGVGRKKADQLPGQPKEVQQKEQGVASLPGKQTPRGGQRGGGAGGRRVQGFRKVPAAGGQGGGVAVDGVVDFMDDHEKLTMKKKAGGGRKAQQAKHKKGRRTMETVLRKPVGPAPASE